MSPPSACVVHEQPQGWGLGEDGQPPLPKKTDCFLPRPQSLICESLIYTVPWINYYQMWNNSCHDN